MEDNKKYVDNDVFKFRIQLKNVAIEKTVYTTPFPDIPIFASDEDIEEESRREQTLVKEKYFTKERIEELKQYFINQIQNSDNPFYIACVDTDSGYNVTEEQLFKW